MSSNNEISRFQGALQAMSRFAVTMSQKYGVPPTEVPRLKDAVQAVWNLASGLVEHHGMNGNDKMNDAEHVQWQEAAGASNSALGMTEQPLFDAWHLFYIEVTGNNRPSLMDATFVTSDEDDENTRVRTFMVSANTGCQNKAEEMARYAVDDFLPEGWTVTRTEYVCFCGTDIFKELTEG